MKIPDLYLYNNNKIYKPSDIRSPIFRIFWMMLIILCNIYVVISQIKNNIVQWWVIVLVLIGVPILLYLIIKQFTTCMYGIITEESVVCFNPFKKKMGEFLFKDIKSIYISKYNPAHDIVIKDIHGKKLAINVIIEPMDEFFNTLINRATNCELLDLRRLEKLKQYPRLVKYEK